MLMFKVPGGAPAKSPFKVEPKAPATLNFELCTLHGFLSTDRILLDRLIAGCDLQGGGNVVRELGFERFDRVKWPDVPQTGQEFDFQRLTIERALEANEV